MSGEKLNEEKLIETGINHFLFEEEKYFDVKQIKVYFPLMKLNTDNIRENDGIRGVRAIDIEPMTEFDMNIFLHKFKK